MDTESKAKINYTTEYVVAAGYAIFFCSLVIACLGFFYLNLSQPVPEPARTNEFTGTLPLTTPTPHIPSNHQFETNSILFQEDFDNNQNRWLNSEDDTKERIHAGRLFFMAREDGDYAILRCESCPHLDRPYYLEVSLSTDIATDETYGIAFRCSATLEAFYLFIINPESKKYFLYHRDPEEWTLRAAGESLLIHPYPESNTLGAYASKDSLEFYINGEIVDSYRESGTSFDAGFFGIYTNNSWYGVQIDKVVIYRIGE